jgi:DNA polymerase (family 10)
MDNREIARILRETAQLLEIDGALIGRYRSYERAADLIGSLPESAEELCRAGKLTELPGVGDRLAEHIAEICKTGDYSLRQKLLKRFPPTLLQVLKLQSLGPKKVAFLWKKFKAGTVEDIAALAREGKLRDLPGFGEKSEQNILKAAEVFTQISGRFRLDSVEAQATRLATYITAFGKLVGSVVPAGSFRRGKETVGDLDLLVTLAGAHKATDVDALAEHVLAYPDNAQTLAHGENKVSFRLAGGLQVDVRLLEPESYGAALLYFTGSKEHNVTLRGRARDLGYTLNEYALTTLKGNRRVAGATEEEIYAKLKLDFVPPELRENAGEIEAAEAHRLPNLVELKDIRGDLQMHTTASDGRNSIEEMAAAARELGYDYIALTDHSKNITVANGLDEARTREQIAKIKAVNSRNSGFRILAGSEVDILKDGRLDLDDEVLAELEVVVVSVHSYMNLERAEMTERLLAAIENPYTQIMGHPTGRRLLRRDEFPFDVEKILDAAARHKVALECNASPERLDLKDTYLRMAKDRGIPIVISTDAHGTAALKFMRYGVQTARRGWLEKKDVINTLPLDKFLAALRPKPGVSAANESRPIGEPPKRIRRANAR